MEQDGAAGCDAVSACHGKLFDEKRLLMAVTDKQREAVAAEYNANRTRLIRLRVQLEKARQRETDLKRRDKIQKKIDRIDRELNKVKMDPISIAMLIIAIVKFIMEFLKKEPVA